MDYYIDTEFYERGRVAPIELLSIALVAQDGREYYAQVLDAVSPDPDSWVAKNVLPHFEHARFDRQGKIEPSCHPHASQHPGDCVWKTATRIAMDLFDFCNPSTYGPPRFVGYYADYDWVCFAQLFGAMVDLPPGFPMYCYDLKQLCDDLGNPKLPAQGKGEHHALADARWNKLAYEFLQDHRTALAAQAGRAINTVFSRRVSEV